MLLLTNTARADSYAEAQSAAQKAFLIQSGIQTTIDQTRYYFERKARIYSDKIGFTPYALTGGIVYRIYRTRMLEIPYKNQTWSLGFSDSYLIQWKWSY